MTVTDVQNACYRDMRGTGFTVIHYDDMPDSLPDERLVIRTGSFRDAAHWTDGSVELILACPDVRGQVTARLGDMESEFKDFMDSLDVMEWGGEYYHYELLNRAIEQDRQMKCHYAHYTYNFKLLY